jgi:hypothetical protein
MAISIATSKDYGNGTAGGGLVDTIKKRGNKIPEEFKPRKIILTKAFS